MLREADRGHLSEAQTCASGVVALVQHEVDGCAAEADDAQVVGEGESPGNVQGIGLVGGDIGVEGGGEDEEDHVGGKEVGLKEAVEEVEDAEPVGGADVAVCDVGEDAVLGLALFHLLVGGGEIVGF